MAEESSDIPAQAEWEMLSMTASTLGFAPNKPEEGSSSPPQETPQPTEDEELSQQNEGKSKDMEPLTGLYHENLVYIDKDPNICVSPGESSKTTVKVSWWKRQVTLSQPQSHKYNAVLSIALVVAVVGIAVIGHRLFRERTLNSQLRLELAAKDEKLINVMQQVKEAAIGRRRIGVTRGSSF
ncbi:hypothetical protein GOP47_0028240 [Adiantum capillus-veneris]|nr:hypothetical protein GOP47_0028240 [Adiantum capillus-veneris]